MLFSSACMVGPNYRRPTAAVPAGYKEAPTSDFKESNGWKQAQPGDSLMKGKWWELYNDFTLNGLEEQVAINNQNVLVAEANYRLARANTRAQRAELSPALGTSPTISGSRTYITSPTGSTFRAASSLPVDASWGPDLWGRVRRGVTAAAATAQASAAELENARLLYQALLAEDYFLLHGLDSQYDLLDRTLKSYQVYLTLTKDRFTGGVATDLDVAEAESQVYNTQSELQDLGVARAQYEHAIAVLTGRPPAELSISSLVLQNPAPPIPLGLPSTLLERRPDIAAGERQMAAANEQIGIATAAYYPSLTLGVSAGLQNSGITQWFSWPSRFFSVGPSLAGTLFDAGHRRAVLAGTQASFDATIAAYRQTVLMAFQEVEDNLAALRILSEESDTARQAVVSSERALTVSTAQYKVGLNSYLSVITAQASALEAARTAVELLTRRLVASVLLIQALGGGWDVSQLPTQEDVRAKNN
jgi:NodT family efflux transporter outer membrane factor (OMF) lipoprotein